jgi:hypothetical protein
MKPTLGWTMLSRAEMRAVERSLANGEQETRDEIGFLLLHQGFADRFFPGTSVLHTRLRYILFVPWIYEDLAHAGRRGLTLKAAVDERMLQLAHRLKNLGGEATGVIGGDLVKEWRLSSQPPDRVYWSALRTWKILSADIHSTRDALQRIAGRSNQTARDVEGAELDPVNDARVFSLPQSPPEKWGDTNGPLTFKLSAAERKCLREKIGVVPRADGERSLLGNLVSAQASFRWERDGALPVDLDEHADAADKRALAVARDAAHLAAIGRMVYGALVERLCEADGIPPTKNFGAGLVVGFEKYGAAAARCNLDEVDKFVPGMTDLVKRVLIETQLFVRSNKPDDFGMLFDAYRAAEVDRKSSRRARLGDVGHAKDRREEWLPERHKTPPLHYRWDVVHSMLQDLNGGGP